MNEKEKVIAKLRALGVQSLDLEIKSEHIHIPKTEKHPNFQEEEKTSYKRGFDYAVKILAMKDYSIHKMKEKLHQRDHTEEDIEKIITRLLELNYLREEAYTKARIKQMLVKGYANSYIIQKLAYEHLEASDQVIDSVREEEELGSNSQIDKLIQKKLRYKEIPESFEEKMKLKNKVSSFLVSKGYNFDDISSKLENYF